MEWWEQSTAVLARSVVILHTAALVLWTAAGLFALWAFFVEKRKDK